MDYTKECVEAAACLLNENSEIVERLKAYASSLDLNEPFEKAGRFHESVGKRDAVPLLIAAARLDIIDFANAHLCLKTELLFRRGKHTTPQDMDAAVDDAYFLLDQHGAVNSPRIERVAEDNRRYSDRLRAVFRPAETRVLDFYAERENLQNTKPF